MEVLETKSKVVQALNGYRNRDISIGFVPTMGALHRGHLSLLERCAAENPVAVASIFVNPTQFNDRNDFVRYPRNVDKDLEMLNKAGCNFVFVPSELEMYPELDTRIFDFGILDKVMEGACRPGHFNGVAQIVSKLFDVVEPNRAYFGKKDFQQLAIIKRLVEMQKYNIDIVGCPTIRENDGLAMSSRNVLLTAQQRQNATKIYKSLLFCNENINKIPLEELKKTVIEQINGMPEMEVEYFEIVEPQTLETIVKYEEKQLQACIAVRVGKVRLIDNITIEN